MNASPPILRKSWKVAMQPAEALQIKVLRSVAELQSIEEEWATLWSQDIQATPFQSPQWLIPWAQCFGANQLISIAIYRDEKLVALVPLYIYTCPQSHQRQLLLLGAGTSDYLGCVTDKKIGEDVLKEMLRELLSQNSWDIAHFNQLRSGSPLLRLPIMDPRVSVSDAETCTRILLQSPHSLPAKLRHSIAYYRRRAEAIGPLKFVRASSSAMALDFFELLVELHSRRWRTLGELGVLTDPCVLAHHRAAIPQLCASEILRIYALQLNGKTIGVIYVLTDPPGRRNRSFYYYLSGFNPEFHSLSPGTLLLAGVVNEATAEGAMAVDLLRGQEAYKKFWGAEPMPTYALNMISPGTRA